MSYIFAFLAGLACGMALLMQAQDTAYKAEANCFNSAQHNGTLTKQSCKTESAWLEKVT